MNHNSNYSPNQNMNQDRNENRNYKKIFGLLGIAVKAGKVKSGEFMVEKMIQSSQATLVFVAEDASDNTKKLFQNKCNYYKVPLYTLATKEELGHAIGCEFRAAVCITDEGFRDALIKLL